MINNYLLRSVIYGGIDGIITMFNIVASISGAELNYKYIFILGIAVLLSDSMSMGISDYLSIKADIKQKTNKDKLNLVKDINPIKNGGITMISFIFFGSIPIILFFLLGIGKHNKLIKLSLSVVISLFILGILQSKFTNEKWYISGSKLSLFGLTTSLIAFKLSSFFMNLVK